MEVRHPSVVAASLPTSSEALERVDDVYTELQETGSACINMYGHPPTPSSHVAAPDSGEVLPVTKRLMRLSLPSCCEQKNDSCDVCTRTDESHGLNKSLLAVAPSPEAPSFFESIAHSEAKKKLIQASVLCACFMVVEIVAGILANSLAIMVDAAHMLSDLSAFLISLLALWMAELPGNHELSFGYSRAEILGATTSIVVIWVMTIFLVKEAIERVSSPLPVNGAIMFLTGTVGLVQNLVATRILGIHSHGIGEVHTHGNNDSGCGNHGGGHGCHGSGTSGASTTAPSLLAPASSTTTASSCLSPSICRGGTSSAAECVSHRCGTIHKREQFATERRGSVYSSASHHALGLGNSAEAGQHLPSSDSRSRSRCNPNTELVECPSHSGPKCCGPSGSEWTKPSRNLVQLCEAEKCSSSNQDLLVPERVTQPITLAGNGASSAFHEEGRDDDLAALQDKGTPPEGGDAQIVICGPEEPMAVGRAGKRFELETAPLGCCQHSCRQREPLVREVITEPLAGGCGFCNEDIDARNCCPILSKVALGCDSTRTRICCNKQTDEDDGVSPGEKGNDFNNKKTQAVNGGIPRVLGHNSSRATAGPMRMSAARWGRHSASGLACSRRSLCCGETTTSLVPTTAVVGRRMTHSHDEGLTGGSNPIVVAKLTEPCRVGDMGCLDRCSFESATSFIVTPRLTVSNCPDNSKNENVNLKAAYLHVVGDLVQNVGVILAGGVIWRYPQMAWVDPACTFIFSIIVICTTLSIAKVALNVLMEGVPQGVNLTALKQDLLQIRSVQDVHDLHVWSLSVGRPSLACHLVIDCEEMSSRVLYKATSVCQSKYGILHTTIQVDLNGNNSACETDAHARCFNWSSTGPSSAAESPAVESRQPRLPLAACAC